MGTLNFKFELSGFVGVLKIDSNLTPTSSEGFNEALKMSLNLADHVIVNLEKVKEFDLSCLKILCSNYIRSKKVKKLLTPVSKSMSAMKGKLEVSGYCQNICMIPGHMTHDNHDCIWVK